MWKYLLLFVGIFISLQLSQPVQAAQSLQVIQVTPQGMVDNLTQITVRFSEDMRALGAMEQDAASAPAQLVPGVAGAELPAGNWRWLDPSTLAYLFATPLSGSVEFTLVVPKGVQALSGATLDKQVSCQISAPAIAFAMYTSSLGPEASIIVQSNQPVDVDSLASKSTLLLNNQPVEYSLSKIDYNYQQPPSRYTFALKQKLPPNARLELKIDKGVKPIHGFINSPQAYAFKLEGYQNLKLTNWRVGYYSNNADKPGEAGSPLVLNFNNPVKYSDLLEHISISPEIEIDQQAGHSSNSNSHALALNWQPRSSYQVTIKPGLKDNYGTSLNKAITFKVKIGDYHPLIKINTGVKVAEASLGGIYPIMLRNITPIEVFAKLTDWNQQTFSGIFERNVDSVSMLKLPAKLLQFPPNSVQNYSLEMAELFKQDIVGKVVNLALRYKLPDSKDKNLQYAQLQVTNLGISFKMAEKQGLAWVTALDTAQPIAEAKLVIYAYDGQQLWSGRTDENGLAVLPGMNELQLKSHWPILMASFGQDKACVPLAWSQELSYGGSISMSERMEVQVISQLPIYQPGQQVHFLAYLRSASPEGWQALANHKVKLQLSDSRGESVLEQEVTLNSYGSAPATLTLAEDAPLGYYQLSVRSLENSNLYCYSQAFQVAAFRTPDFKVDLSAPPDQPAPLAKGTLSGQITAAYFFGAPVKNASGELSVSQSEQYFVPQRLNGYRVGLGTPYYDYMPYHDRMLHLPEQDSKQLGKLSLLLDSQGRQTIVLPEPDVSPGKTVSIELQALVSDPSGLSTQGAAGFMVHSSSYFVGLKTPYLGKANEPIKIELKACTHDNQPLSDVPVKLSVQQRYVEGEPTVLEKQVVINSVNGISSEITIKQGGSYTLKASVKDSQGRENITTTDFIVTGHDMVWSPYYHDSGNLELIADQQSYQPGDVARVVVKNPFSGPARALITMEKAGILNYRVQEISGPAPVLEIELAKDNAPYTYVSVLLIKGRSAPPPQNGGSDLGKPAVALGRLLLDVEKTSDDFSISLNAKREQYRPGQQVEVEVKASQQCQITLLAVDKRVLRVAGDQTNYLPAFEAMQWLGVATADIRTRLQDLSSLADSATDMLRHPPIAAPSAMMAAERMEQMDIIVGTGPDNGDQAQVRQNFSPAAYWLASVETDKNGYYKASFKLPDSLTAYEIVAVAADTGERFAKASQEITVSQPLQLTSSLPGFITQGDEFIAQFLAHNLSNRAATIVVELEANGAEMLSPVRQQFRVEAKGNATFNYQLKAPSVGQLSLLLKASMNSENDAVRFTLPVLPALPLVSVAAAGILDSGQSYTLPVDIPQDFDSRSRLQVVLAPSPAAGLPLSAQAVMDYPWDCLEQRMSKAALRITRLLHGELVGLAPEADDRDKAQAVFDTVGKFQNGDGGFGLWGGVRESDFYLTAYVLLIDSQGKQVGVRLKDQVRQQALNFLANQVNRQLTNDTDKYLALDTQAMAAYVLAVNQQSQANSYLTALNKQINKMNPMGLAALMLAYNAAKQPQPANLLVTLEKHAAITSTELHFNTPNAQRCWYSMGSPLRDNALVLMALSQTNYPRLEALALWVSRSLGEKTYFSTQEAMFGIWGIGSYLKSLGGNQQVDIQAVWNNGQPMRASFSRLVEAAQSWQLDYEQLNPGANSLSLQAIAGKPYWTARLSYASLLNQQAINAGFTIERRWLTPGPWKMGQIVEVELTVTVPNWRRHVLVYDPFPAGLEPLYATRADLAQQNLQYYPPWMWQEMRKDGLLLYSTSVAPGTYTYKYGLRAFAPGKFIQRATQVEEMYTPEVFGRTIAGQVEVLPEK